MRALLKLSSVGFSHPGDREPGEHFPAPPRGLEILEPSCSETREETHGDPKKRKFSTLVDKNVQQKTKTKKQGIFCQRENPFSVVVVFLFFVIYCKIHAMHAAQALRISLIRFLLAAEGLRHDVVFCSRRADAGILHLDLGGGDVFVEAHVAALAVEPLRGLVGGLYRKRDLIVAPPFRDGLALGGELAGNAAAPGLGAHAQIREDWARVLLRP